MRLVSDHVEFSWVVTAAVVAVFPIFGVGHLISSVLRRRGGASSKIGRGGGVLLTLPLFGAAGGMMLPTVVWLTCTLACELATFRSIRTSSPWLGGSGLRFD